MKEPVENSEITAPKVNRRDRCMEWLQNQHDLRNLAPDNKTNVQSLTDNLKSPPIKSKVLINVDDDGTVPIGVGEPNIVPKDVPIRRLRVEDLQMECEWQSCKCLFSIYELFQQHVATHFSELQVMNSEEAEYSCLWDICGHKTSDLDEMERHINYHAYHSHLLAIGFNGRVTLKLEQCKKDSSKRNHLPPLKHRHCCMWVGCSASFNSIQAFFNHVNSHVQDAKELCSWAGCGASFPRRSLLTMHMRSHTRERLIACYHCGLHYSCNRKLSDHLLRQNVNPETGIPCEMCGILCATEYLKREHERQHISAYACAMCDMSAPSPAALAYHVRYRHLSASVTRIHACPDCPYKAVTKSDLKKHMPIHRKKELSDEDSSEDEVRKKKKTKVKKKYACHMCPEKEVKIFSRGTRLTTHLVKVHGAQWPFGYSRFRYQISEDGMYRLTTTRFEYEDISKKIVDGYSDPKESLNNTFKFDVKQTAEATQKTPKRFQISLKNNSSDEELNDSEGIVKENECDAKKSEANVENESTENGDQNSVEIMMCDVDEDGNIINSETIQSYQLLV